MAAPAPDGRIGLKVEVVEDPQVQASLWVDEVRVGRLVFAEWPIMIVCYTLDVDDGPWQQEVAAHALSFLLQRWSAGTFPDTYLHVSITQPWMLRLYQASPLAEGCVVTGTIGLHTLYHDRLMELGEEHFAEAERVGTLGATGIVLTYARDLSRLAKPGGLAVEDVVALLRSEIPSTRIGALRALSKDGPWQDADRDRAFMFALLDPSYEVRRFASVSLGGFFPGVPYAPALDVLLEHLARPLQSLDALGVRPIVPEGIAWDDAHGVRNKRYGILWVLGALCGLSHPTATLSAWREAEHPRLQVLLEAQRQAHTPARDHHLATLAAAELIKGPGRYGVGQIPDQTVFDLLRYVVIRFHLVARLANPDEDRFYWMMDMVDLVLPSAHSPKAGWASEDGPTALEATLYGPAPEVPLPVDTLPDWLKGRWSDQAVELV